MCICFQKCEYNYVQKFPAKHILEMKVCNENTVGKISDVHKFPAKSNFINQCAKKRK